VSKETGGHAEGKKLAVVIMAAGKGTRLKARRPKALHSIGGKPLLSHVIAAASQLVEPSEIFVVIGYEGEQVKAAVAVTGVSFVDQKEQRGTGHAIQCARQAIAGYENILVLPGDVPLISPKTIRDLWNFHQHERAVMTILTATPDNPAGYGRVQRGSSNSHTVEAIVEQKALTPDQRRNLTEINSGVYAFQTAPLLAHIDKLNPNNALSELCLTDMARLLAAAGERVAAMKAPSAAEVLGADTIAELVALDATLRIATANRLMAAGVTIFRPETCLIDAEVDVAADTVIEPFVQLLGATRIGSDCLIRSYSVIENCTLGNRVLIRQSCMLEESTLSDGAQIGPFAHLRPGSEIGEGAHVGNFVETKKAKLGNGVKAGHLTYLGDVEVGQGTNIGAGVITCNYDGVRKHKTTIGRNVFVGSDSTLVAPVTIEDEAYVGAGSCITKVVPEGSLAVARAHQFVKEGWVAARRTHQKTRE
jgi:bifunctional UDP-N-acetylglucosamine pyrophosphorylase / glucosamine-1-phosphate N-acetyltransferase